ncbi:hypothetical protein E3T55_04465 [Cryobacterium frigoriphilum]|uniref:Peptidase M4 domain-containing protein n=1 Tax=Cryobacterium frigoriphilum TaxID=1259150 RepID=A0A4R9A7V6_9MICO|nr:hypothetical protein [Cryobacterium frigoriphilum]TFD53949.1 hypothetical protein E3T55_04465 [Cryobacterium frigoriphilum]
MPTESDLITLTALAEGPNTSGPNGALLTRVRVPVERITLDAHSAATMLSARFAISVNGTAPQHRRRPALADLADPRPPWGCVDRAPSPHRVDLLADRRFLAQHVYAVAASTLFVFESTLGRRMGWAGGKRLSIFAYDQVAASDSGYDRDERSIRLGHYADDQGPGRVPLALFRDVVAHEVTHAIIDGYRPRWADAHAGIDALALHEAIADLVAILSVFAADERVEQLLAGVVPPVADQAALVGITTELLRGRLFGFGDGLASHTAAHSSARSAASRYGLAGRNSLTDEIPDDWRTLPSPHARSQAVVHALLAVVVRLWVERIDRPGGRASLVQVASAGAIVGRRVLTMLVRGLGYLPPVDTTWEDLLHGILAADEQLVPGDDNHYRDAVVEAFAAIGVRRATPVDVAALAPQLRYPIRLAALGSDPEEVLRLIWENPALIEAAGLDPARSITVDRVRPSVRVSPDGFVVSEIGASFTQEFLLDRAEARRAGLPAAGPVLIRRGGLLRFDEGGRLSFAAFAPTVPTARNASTASTARTASIAPPVRRRATREVADAADAPQTTGTAFHQAMERR